MTYRAPSHSLSDTWHYECDCEDKQDSDVQLQDEYQKKLQTFHPNKKSQQCHCF